MLQTKPIKLTTIYHIRSSIKMAKECCEDVMALNEPGLLYIIQEATSQYFKVGVSKNDMLL
jgi:hypothetical protein